MLVTSYHISTICAYIGIEYTILYIYIYTYYTYIYTYYTYIYIYTYYIYIHIIYIHIIYIYIYIFHSMCDTWHVPAFTGMHPKGPRSQGEKRSARLRSQARACCSQLYIYIHTHTYLPIYQPANHACMHTYRHTCIHPYIHTSIHPSIHPSIHTDDYIQTITYVCFNILKTPESIANDGAFTCLASMCVGFCLKNA